MLFLGVDGGGTKTSVLLVDERGQILGTGKSAGSNYHSVGLETTFANVKLAVDQVLEGRTPDAACFCMAGADLPHDFDNLYIKLSGLGFECPFIIRNDVLGALRAGSRFPYGVAVVCGTSFNAAGVGKDGIEFRLPALGPISGDIAGARRLAIRALGAAFRSWDGRGEPTILVELILEALGAPDFPTIASRWGQNQIDDEQLKSLAPLVFEASKAGDMLAQQFVYEQGLELGTAANAMLTKVNLIDSDCDVVLSGSVFYGEGDLLMGTINKTISEFAPNAKINRLEVLPVVGAAMLAADHVGKSFKSDFITTLPSAMKIPAVF
jgi:N-acetylglucosamine kinase-like BadF-type ATPase